MRSIWRTALTLGSMMAAVCLFSTSFGALSISAGLSAPTAWALSFLVFAGTAQVGALGVLLAGGGEFAAVGTGLLLNARYVAMGFGLRSIVEKSSRKKRALASFLLTEEALFPALAASDTRRARQTYWLFGPSIFLAMGIGTVLGTTLGSELDLHQLGLDGGAAAAMLAFLRPLIREYRHVLIAGSAAVTTIVLAAILPQGVALIGAALSATIVGRARNRSKPAAG